MNEPSKPNLGEQLTKISLTLVFLAIIGIFAWTYGPARLLETLRSWGVLEFFLLGVACFRLGRLVAYDRVMEPIRRPFAQTVPDSSGAGDSVEPRGEGARQALGQLITCPICAGTWIAMLLVIALVWIPGPARLFLWAAAAIGAAEIINSAVEAWCWAGELSRARTGEIRKGK